MTPLWTACAVLLLVGCPKSDPPADADPGTKTPAAGDAAGKKAATGPAGGTGPVGSVYPASPAPSAEAEALCKTMQETARVRRGECCQSKPGVLLTKECTRVVSGSEARARETPQAVWDPDAIRIVAAPHLERLYEEYGEPVRMQVTGEWIGAPRGTRGTGP